MAGYTGPGLVIPAKVAGRRHVHPVIPAHGLVIPSVHLEQRKKRAATLPGMTGSEPSYSGQSYWPDVHSRSYRLQARYERLIKKQQDSICFGDLCIGNKIYMVEFCV